MKRELKTYQEILQEMEKSFGSKHLLLGNGFNLSLGIQTNYKNIFEKMKAANRDYEGVENTIKVQGYDIEVMIQKIKEQVRGEDEFLNEFLYKYIEGKIKLDFMKAAMSIISKKTKHIYQEKNQGVYMLLKNFNNYFTLNYDPFLYLFLMKYKKDTPNSVFLLGEARLFQGNHMSEIQNEIYIKIKEAHDRGQLSIKFEQNDFNRPLSSLIKTRFEAVVKEFFRGENWKGADIKKAINCLWREKRNNQSMQSLIINDGFDPENFYIHPSQNLFFLHGGFHIYKRGQRIMKIMQEGHKSFCERLEEITSSEEKDIVCVFTGKSEDKQQQINEDLYLTKGIEKLSTLDGLLMIIGSSLGENDKHIFESISGSEIHSVYISAGEENKDKIFESAKKMMPNKRIVLFDYKTICYEQ